MSSQKQKNRRVEVGGGGPPKLPFDNSTRTQSASVGSVDGEGEGADREQYREFYLPQVQRLIIMVLMRSRCSRVRQREGEGGRLEERGVACPGRAYMEVLSRDSQIPLSLQPTRSLSRVNIYSASAISKH